MIGYGTMTKASNLFFGALVVVLVALVGWLALGRAGVVPQNNVPVKQPSTKHKTAYLSKNDETLKVDTIGPRKWKMIDIHEHAKGEVEARQLLKAMDKLGIQRVALMASTTYTLTLDPKYGFEGFKENGDALLEIKKKWPDRFSAFVTFDPCDGSDNLAYVKDAVARGADGVKLYLGHGASTPRFAFHCQPINHPSMMPFWAWVEEVQLPVLIHVNLEKYWDEMLDVFEKHPYLRVTLPHFGLHKNTGPRLQRLGFLLERYPNVYTDVSFGFHTFQVEGFEALAANRTRSRDFFRKHKDKIMYASDMVLEPTKDEPYIDNTLRSYAQFLEMEKWRFFLVPDFTMHGMGLDDETLRTIYEVAPKNFLLLDDKGMPPDRSKNPKVEVPRPPMGKLTPEMIPQLPKPAPKPPKGSAPAPAPAAPGTPSSVDDEDDKSKEAGCELESDGEGDDEGA
jgi:predicted TIM-barrel fold metal-dependent hydrolase